MKILLLALMIPLMGCQTMMYGSADQLNDLKVGMSRAQVADRLGSPTSTRADADKNEEAMVYRKMRSTMSWGPTLYVVVLRNDRVIKWGEESR